MSSEVVADRELGAGGEATIEGEHSPAAEPEMRAEPSPADKMIVLDETIHQPTRLRIMTLLVSVPEADRLAYGFIQQTLGLTGGNLTIHLRKLETADFVAITKEFQGSKPRTWVQATTIGRQAFAKYLSNLERTLGFRLHGAAASDGQAGRQ